MDTSAPLGRRDRNKAAKRAAIVRAASELFADQGYAGTTTQQVARAAEVAEGTVFRYAVTKPELLLMVINEHLRPLVAAAPATPPGMAPDQAVLAILDPIIDLAEEQPDNAAPFLREVLFGDDGPQRDESLQIVRGLHHRIAEVLAPYDGDYEGMSLEEVAGWLFSTVVTALLRGLVGFGPADQRAGLRGTVRVLLRGLGIPVGQS